MLTWAMEAMAENFRRTGRPWLRHPMNQHVFEEAAGAIKKRSAVPHQSAPLPPSEQLPHLTGDVLVGFLFLDRKSIHGTKGARGRPTQGTSARRRRTSFLMVPRCCTDQWHRQQWHSRIPGGARSDRARKLLSQRHRRHQFFILILCSLPTCLFPLLSCDSLSVCPYHHSPNEWLLVALHVFVQTSMYIRESLDLCRASDMDDTDDL